MSRRNHLRAAFAAPTPTRKHAFLSAAAFPRATRFHFIAAQIGYIRKRVWGISILSSAMAILSLRLHAEGDDLLRIVSSFLPFLILVSMTEIARSLSYNMDELEMSCRFSFSDVVLARLWILGCANLIAFTVIVLSLGGIGGFGLFRIGVYLLTPFMLTCSLSLCAFNHMRAREGITLCGVISCLVGLANAVWFNPQKAAFADRYVLLWCAAVFLLLCWTAWEINQLTKRTEEMQWSLSLTA